MKIGIIPVIILSLGLTNGMNPCFGAVQNPNAPAQVSPPAKTTGCSEDSDACSDAPAPAPAPLPAPTTPSPDVAPSTDSLQTPHAQGPDEPSTQNKN